MACGLYEMPDKENKEHHSYSPSNTCCIHSCGHLREVYIEQRSWFAEEDEPMLATVYFHHLHLDHRDLLLPDKVNNNHYQKQIQQSGIE